MFITLTTANFVEQSWRWKIQSYFTKNKCLLPASSPIFIISHSAFLINQFLFNYMLWFDLCFILILYAIFQDRKAIQGDKVKYKNIKFTFKH